MLNATRRHDVNKLLFAVQRCSVIITEMSDSFLAVYFSYTNRKPSLQKAFINLPELCGAFFYDGWMHFIGLQNLNTHSLLL